MKTHYLIELQLADGRNVNFCACNGNGVPNVSLCKRYNLTTEKDKVTCKICLKHIKNLEAKQWRQNNEM